MLQFIKRQYFPILTLLSISLKPIETYHISKPSTTEETILSTKSKDTSKTSIESYIIRGNVYTETNQGLLAASVFVHNHKTIACTTDYSGHFELRLPLKYQKKNFSLRVISVGFLSLKIKINNKKAPLDKDLNLHMKLTTIDPNEVIYTCRTN